MEASLWKGMTMWNRINHLLDHLLMAMGFALMLDGWHNNNGEMIVIGIAMWACVIWILGAEVQMRKEASQKLSRKLKMLRYATELDKLGCHITADFIVFAANYTDDYIE